MKRRAICLILSIILCWCLIPVQSSAVRDTSYEESLAVQLKTLGLFKGVSETNFDLGRPPTRTEALVILIRLLGKEQDALASNWRHPFTDVASWSDHYIGYAYQNGLTNGISDTKFGTGNADAAMFVTFVLRALGYSDTNGMDFTWNSPYALASAIGILPQSVDTVNFWRADAVVVSYYSLSAKMKNSVQTLAEKLISDGVFTKAQYESIQAGSLDPSQGQSNGSTASNGSSTVSVQPALSSEEIYSKCSPAVFCIQTYDVYGRPYALGSGFFIDQSGIAVTNHHVLENAVSATATLANGSVRAISGVIYYSDEDDYAVIKVEGSGYTSLPLGDSSSIAGGQSIYTIGNPQGLTNTIANGIISNPSRADFNGMIQITAPISSGSSGGALINEYGQVLGVTTGSLTSGQNLNFAVPISYVIDEGENIANMPRTYGMYTMTEYAEENGYLGNRKVEALNILKSYINTHSNTTYTSYKTIELQSGNNYFNIYYASDRDEVRIACEQYQNGNRYNIIFNINNNSEDVFLGYYHSIYNSNTGSYSSLVDAYCNLNSETSYIGMPIAFTKYEGASNLRSSSEKNASSLYSLGLLYLSDTLTAACPSREYIIDDLGFPQVPQP